MSEESISPVKKEIDLALADYLLPEEKLIWRDKPQQNWRRELRPALPLLILFFIGFSLFFSAFYSARQAHSADSVRVTQPVIQEHPNPPTSSEEPSFGFALLFSAGMALFFSFWFYMVFKGIGGSRFLNLFSLSRTYYGLTDARLIIVSGRKEFCVLAYQLRALQDLRLQVQPDGFGTIQFGQKQWPYKNPFQQDLPPLVLKNISEATQVFNLIAQAQKKLLA